MQRQIKPSLQGHFSKHSRVEALFYYPNKKKTKKTLFFQDFKGKIIFLLCIFKVKRQNYL